MTADRNLYLHEEIMLLALRDKEGTVASGTMYNFAIGGADFGRAPDEETD